jgi:hypothetical protein
MKLVVYSSQLTIPHIPMLELLFHYYYYYYYIIPCLTVLEFRQENVC